MDFAFTAAGRIEEVGGTSAVGRPNLDYAPTAGGYGDGTLAGGDSGGARYMTVSFDDASDIQPSRIRVWMGGAEIWYEPGAGQMDVAKEFGHLSLGALNIGRVKKETTGATTVTTAEGSFHNGLSHLMGAVDWDSGVVTAAFVYGPFGEVVASVGAEEDEHLRRFNGKEADLESGLSYYGYRYYDSKSLSWTQADPLYLVVPDFAGANPREMTLYAFSMNNPIRYMDPDGLQAKDTPSPKTTVEKGCTDGTEDCLQEDEKKKNAAFVADAEAKFRRWEEGFTIGGIPVAGAQGVLGFVEGTRQEAALIKAGVSLSKQFGWKAPAAWVAINAAVVTAVVVGPTLAAWLGLRTAPVVAPVAAVNPRIYAQLQRQLNSDGAKSIFKALRTANRTLQSHLNKLPDMGPFHAPGVEKTIGNVRSQIATLEQFIIDK